MNENKAGVAKKWEILIIFIWYIPGIMYMDMNENKLCSTKVGIV